LSEIFRGQLSHIEIYVSNLTRSEEFWDWFLKYLGYRSYQKWDRGKSWIKNGTYIVLVQTREKYLDRPFNRCHTGLNHLAFYSDSKEDIDRLTAELKSREIKILYEDRHPHAAGEDSYALFFEDPERIKIEVIFAENGSI
jgi:catechol 2,3-dioxygenase-like lactoylglutathione lyase family enzyme